MCELRRYHWKEDIFFEENKHRLLWAAILPPPAAYIIQTKHCRKACDNAHRAKLTNHAWWKQKNTQMKHAQPVEIACFWEKRAGFGHSTAQLGALQTSAARKPGCVLLHSVLGERWARSTHTNATFKWSLLCGNGRVPNFCHKTLLPTRAGFSRKKRRCNLWFFFLQTMAITQTKALESHLLPRKYIIHVHYELGGTPPNTLLEFGCVSQTCLFHFLPPRIRT